MIQTNPRPSYHATPYHTPETGVREPNMFGVYENGQFSFKMSNLGDRFQELLKRGIPADEARTVFYQMDGPGIA